MPVVPQVQELSLKHKITTVWSQVKNLYVLIYIDKLSQIGFTTYMCTRRLFWCSKVKKKTALHRWKRYFKKCVKETVQYIQLYRNLQMHKRNIYVCRLVHHVQTRNVVRFVVRFCAHYEYFLYVVISLCVCLITRAYLTTSLFLCTLWATTWNITSSLQLMVCILISCNQIYLLQLYNLTFYLVVVLFLFFAALKLIFNVSNLILSAAQYTFCLTAGFSTKTLLVWLLSLSW